MNKSALCVTSTSNHRQKYQYFPVQTDTICTLTVLHQTLKMTNQSVPFARLQYLD